MTRVRYGSCLLGVFLSVVVGAPVATAAAEFRIGYNRVWTTPALLIAKAQGLFEQRGVSVRWMDFQNPVHVLEGLATGDLEAGVLTEPDYVIARERGMKVEAVALLAGWSEPPSTFFVRRDAGIRRVEDLRGKTIGINDLGGYFYVSLRYVLEKHGLDPRKDVTIVPIPIPATLQALLAGKIDCGVLPPLFVHLVKTKHAATLQPLFDYRDVDPFRGEMNLLLLVMSQRALTTERDAAARFLRGYLAAVRWMHANPRAAMETWAEAAGLPLLKEMDRLPHVPPDGSVNLTAMQTGIALMQRFGLLKGPLVAAQIVNQTLLGEAREQ